MCDDYIKTINDVDFIYGFIYECAQLINNLHEYDEYLKIKKIIDNNTDVIEYGFAPMINYFDLYKKCYNHYYCSCYNYVFEHIEFHEKIIKIYFNIEYIKFFYLLQKKLNKNICNINVLIDIFINLYDNSDINCNKKNKLLFLINSIMVINIFFDQNLKVVQSELFWEAQVQAQ